MKGRQTRLDEHAKVLKDFLRTCFAEHHAIVNEYIKIIDPEYDSSVWQQFQTTEEVKTAFEKYLNPEGSTPKVTLSNGAPEKLVEKLHQLFKSEPNDFEKRLNDYKIHFTLEIQNLKKNLAL